VNPATEAICADAPACSREQLEAAVAAERRPETAGGREEGEHA
jgi:hypothetical protein